MDGVQFAARSTRISYRTQQENLCHAQPMRCVFPCLVKTRRGVVRMALPHRDSVDVNTRALSLQYPTSGDVFGRRGKSFFGEFEEERMKEEVAGSNVTITREEETRATVKAGAACAWPRACSWPGKRGDREVITGAIAAMASGAESWSHDEDDYALNTMDTFLPPDVELLALFSDSPLSWRAHEDPIGAIAHHDGGAFQQIGAFLTRWWMTMWRYQGLGL